MSSLKGIHGSEVHDVGDYLSFATLRPLSPAIRTIVRTPEAGLYRGVF